MKYCFYYWDLDGVVISAENNAANLFFCVFWSFFSVKPECLLSHCIVAPMLALDPALPANVTLKELPTISPAVSAAKELLTLSKPFQPSTSASVVVFNSQAEGKPECNNLSNMHFTLQHQLGFMVNPEPTQVAHQHGTSDTLVEDVVYHLFPGWNFQCDACWCTEKFYAPEISYQHMCIIFNWKFGQLS